MRKGAEGRRGGQEAIGGWGPGAAGQGSREATIRSFNNNTCGASRLHPRPRELVLVSGELRLGLALGRLRLAGLLVEISRDGGVSRRCEENAGE